MKVPWLSKAHISCESNRLIEGYEARTGHPVRPPVPVEDIIERHLAAIQTVADPPEREWGDPV